MPAPYSNPVIPFALSGKSFNPTTLVKIQSYIYEATRLIDYVFQHLIVL